MAISAYINDNPILRDAARRKRVFEVGFGFRPSNHSRLKKHRNFAHLSSRAWCRNFQPFKSISPIKNYLKRNVPLGSGNSKHRGYIHYSDSATCSSESPCNFNVFAFYPKQVSLLSTAALSNAVTAGRLSL